MLWYLDVFGDRYNLDHLSDKSRAVFQCRNAGEITDVHVRGLTDNYPYFAIDCKIDGFEISVCHKVSYMIGAGGIHWLDGDSRRQPGIHDSVKGYVGYSLTSDGSQVKFIPRSEVDEFIGEAKIEYWITDPRLHYLALLSLLYEPKRIAKWTHFIPTWRQAIDILTRFGLFHRFRETPQLPDDAYDCMGIFYRALTRSKPKDFLRVFSPESTPTGRKPCKPESSPQADKAPHVAHEVFLLNCHVSGTSHAEAAKERANDIRPGLPLTLRREPTNEYDGQATTVLLPSGERIGYIPQKHNPVISRLMDAGKFIFAKVTEAELKGNWLHARMDIFLKD